MMRAVVDGGVMARLKDETAADHKTAEGSQFERALVSGRLPKAAYVEYLAQRLLIHRELEAGVMNLVGSDERLSGVVTPNLLQESNLRRDLAFFGIDAAAIQPRKATAETIETIRQQRALRPIGLLGFYYVLEGSKNGARFIAKAVRPALRLSDEQGTRYLDPHGEQQRPLWQAFRESMNAVPFSSEEADAMVEGAKTMFRQISALDNEIWSAM